MTLINLPRGGSERHWARALLVVLASLTLAATFSAPAGAVPSYARQTGSECAACHVGSFGPQLTPYGIAFKVGGYTDTDGQGTKVPLSAMAVANWTHTAKNLPEAPEHFSDNNNAALQEASLFLAGRLTEHVGSFVQATYSGVDRKTFLDQLDVRYARTLAIGEQQGVVGLSINNNPTLTDPFNTLAQWRFPYTASDFGFGTGPAPLVESLGGSVIGVNAYTLWASNFYAEVGAYRALSSGSVNWMNTGQVATQTVDPGKFSGVGTYWRLAYYKDMKRDNFNVGVFGFNAGVQSAEDPSSTDRYQDIGIDASYQFLGTREHIFTANASYVWERQKLDYSHDVLGAADNAKDRLNTFRLATSYTYEQTWGATLGLFNSRGTADSGLYGSVSYNDRPNTAGYILQADWTPWGKEGSWGAPWANARVGLQYTGYTRYNGGSHYIDDVNGSDRKASDNNTTMLFIWLAI
ncbi:cytochrome C [Accumulibacter sp.]|uniref:cytochrome C n=1 Tax=Accumulibacter sp. TaxID=2053492 RepID=UPI0025E595E3|nr:cytochrome C [Accumulibacter sp.]MCM8595239.1 cytochrome C [Accumulibacter sp.]MCM8626453.1 cytochrome C [Accumulibacter sp.]MDS4049385.1 cytochrome C [Accumulibacter sp.]